MLRNYLKIALRNLVRNKVYSAINIGGLAVGMAVAMLIGLWVYDELSYNKAFANYDRIAQMWQNQTFNGRIGTQEEMPPPLGKSLRTTYGTDFKRVVMSTSDFPSILPWPGIFWLAAAGPISNRTKLVDFCRIGRGCAGYHTADGELPERKGRTDETGEGVTFRIG